MRRLAIFITPLVIGLLPSVGFAQACQNFQQAMGCADDQIAGVPEQGVRKSICNKAKQKIADKCIESDGNSCSRDFRNQASSFNALNTRILNMGEMEARSNSSFDELTAWNRQKSSCTAPAMQNLDTSNCTGGDHGAQRCSSNLYQQHEQQLEEPIANCRMQAMICNCEVEKAKDKVDHNTQSISDEAKTNLKQRIEQSAGCNEFSWAQVDQIASTDQAYADSLAHQAGDTQAAPPSQARAGGDDQKGEATKDSDDDKDTRKKKSSKSSSNNPLSQLASLLQNMPQPQPQNPPSQPQLPDMSTSNCSGANMVGPGCQSGASAAAPQAFPRAPVTGGFQTADASAKGFNPADTSAVKGPTGIPPVNTNNQNQMQPLGASVVANNTGGNIPQSNGGGGGAPASSGGGVMASLAKPFREIMGGLTSYGSGGGYESTNKQLSVAAGGVNTGFGGYSKGGDSEEPMRLADFLPNGARAPAATKGPFGIGGIDGGKVEQIQSSRVNIWNRISDHFKSRCAQGLLRDCFP